MSEGVCNQERFCVDGKEYVVKVFWFASSSASSSPVSSGRQASSRLRYFCVSRSEVPVVPGCSCVSDVMRLIFPGLVFFRCLRGCSRHPVYWGAVAGARREGEKEGAAIRQAGPFGPCEAGGERSVPRPTPTGQTSKAKSPG